MKRLVPLALLALSLTGAASAQIANSNAPISVEAVKDAVWSRAEGTYTFLENVRVVQGGSRLTSDKLVVYCARAETGAAPNRDDPCDPISRIIAEGNVLYTTERESIRGDKAEYDYPTDTITITGKVTMSRGKDLVSGSKVVYEVGKERVTIGSNGERGVFGLFTPDRNRNRTTQPPATPPAPSPN